MLPISNVVLFVPFAVFALLFVTSFVVNSLATQRSRLHGQKAAGPRAPSQTAARPSAQIIYFRPGKTSLPSRLSAGTR